MTPHRAWVNVCDVCPVPTGTTIDAKPKAPCSAGKKQNPCTKWEWCPVSLVVLDGLRSSRRTTTLTRAQHTPTTEENEQERGMRNLNYELKQLCYRNRDGSFATQADRWRMLDLIANQLHELGYKDMGATSL